MAELTIEEKAYWFDLMLKEDFQILELVDKWVVGGGYEGQGSYDESGEGTTLREAYAAYRKEKDQLADNQAKMRAAWAANPGIKTEFTDGIQPSTGCWGGGIQ